MQSPGGDTRRASSNIACGGDALPPCSLLPPAQCEGRTRPARAPTQGTSSTS